MNCWTNSTISLIPKETPPLSPMADSAPKYLQSWSIFWLSSLSTGPLFCVSFPAGKRAAKYDIKKGKPKEQGSHHSSGRERNFRLRRP